MIDHLVDESRTLRVLTGAPSNDAVESETARFTRAERRVPGAPGLFAISLRYAAPLQLDDSLVFDAAGLVPRDERFRLGRTTMEFRFDGNRVRGTVTDGGVARSYDRIFRDPVFPVNAVGTIVRSVPFVAGYEAVIPVFAAQDTSVTYDTLVVAGVVPYEGGGPSARAWHVRVAAPAFILSYLVDSVSRRIVAQELVVRASETRIRLVPVIGGVDERRTASAVPFVRPTPPERRMGTRN